MSYVSCSPPGVPIAGLAAAHAKLKEAEYSLGLTHMEFPGRILHSNHCTFPKLFKKVLPGKDFNLIFSLFRGGVYGRAVARVFTERSFQPVSGGIRVNLSFEYDFRPGRIP